jgi:ThiF family
LGRPLYRILDRLGGSGAYLLDFLVKVPVREIRAYDGDDFHIHTAYRSPGRVEEAEFGQKKADVYSRRYDNFREGLSIEAKYVDASTAKDFDGVTFAFVCVDKGSARREIFDLLTAKRIPFIDVDMGLHRRDEKLTGMMRTTYYSPEDAARVRDKEIAELQDTPDNIYRISIQIAELNALNAALAVIRYKQLRGFYFEQAPNFYLVFDLADLRIVGRTSLDENA